MKKTIENIPYIERGVVAIDGNKLWIKNTDAEVKLSKNQKKLLIGLMNNINEKDVIIKLLWNTENTRSKEMNYHQLIHKTRLRLSRSGFPEDFIMTTPRYGLCLNRNFMHPVLAEQDYHTI